MVKIEASPAANIQKSTAAAEKAPAQHPEPLAKCQEIEGII